MTTQNKIIIGCTAGVVVSAVIIHSAAKRIEAADKELVDAINEYNFLISDIQRELHESNQLIEYGNTILDNLNQ